MWPVPAKSAEPAGFVLAGSHVGKPERAGAKSPSGKRTASKRSRIGEDVLLGLFGVALGLGCALFPWYVFFNQEKFGIRAVQFEGAEQSATGGSSSTPQIARLPDFPEVKDPSLIPNQGLPELDHLATGTTPKADEAAGETPSLLDQPFPIQDVPFRLVHVVNGRAMIQDDTGLWIVQRGSVLPDMSRVAAIEQRDGAWVIVTSADRIVGIAR